MSAEIISFQDYKDKRNQSKTAVAIIADFYMCISGDLPYDDLDQLIDDLEERGVSVDSVMIAEDCDDDTDTPVTHNDIDP